MGALGALGLLLAFVSCCASALLLVAGQIMSVRGMGKDVAPALLWAGRIAVVVCLAALTVCCGVLVFCFLTEDYSLQYVLDQHSRSTGMLGVLFDVAGLWAGREGSLLFWGWLISLFSAGVSLRRLDALNRLDNVAVLVMQLVLAAFLGVLLFSQANAPFSATDAQYYGTDGTLTAAASVMGMNVLLEHWAMAIHPPLLFIGYAGLTVPFAYAVAALISNDSTTAWIDATRRVTLWSWLFLTAGIGLGSVWAYVVLGWGGYWGWDPVENASLLPWLMGVALIHSMTMCRQRGTFKAWTLLCACLTYAFVIVGTFISRSGLVQSVHAFEGDPVSLGLFGFLIAASACVGVAGVIARRASLAAPSGEGAAAGLARSSEPTACDADNTGESAAAGPDSSDDSAVEQPSSLLTREDFYFFNNVVLVAATVLIAYMTISAALPGFMPLGGRSLGAGAYNALARPLGIAYLLLMAVCPLLAWGRSAPRDLLRRMKAPAVMAAVAFGLLMIWFATQLSPAYDATVAAGGLAAADVLEQGPAWYYKGLTVVGLAVASVLLGNSLRMLIKGVRSRRASSLGGGLAHVAMSVILVGLIGSSMYVTQQAGYVDYDAKTDSSTQAFQVRDYQLTLDGTSIDQQPNGNVLYTATFNVSKGGTDLGTVSPSVTLVPSTQQRQQNAAVISLPQEDLFVVYKGVSSSNGGLSVEVRVNPAISLVWAGFALLMVGALVAALGGGHGRAARMRSSTGDKRKTTARPSA